MPRQLRHTRQTTVDIYARDDGLWEVEARLVDTKKRDYALESGTRAAGDPVHDMTLFLVVDTQFNIIESRAKTDWMPYPGYCNNYGAAYTQLAGLNLMRGFRQGVKALVGDVRGCTHLSEMTPAAKNRFNLTAVTRLQALPLQYLNTIRAGMLRTLQPRPPHLPSKINLTKDRYENSRIPR
jgi:hypothetical protein